MSSLQPYYSRIIGAGHALPSKVMTNKDYEAYLDTTDEWIVSRTGIRERRFVDRSEGESTVTIAFEACQKALDQAGCHPKDLDFIVVGTLTPDMIMPCTALQLQDLLGARNCFGFDLAAACSGFLYALSVGDNFCRSNMARCGLVVGVDVLSSIVNWQDRSTVVLFGDAAGAAVIKQTQDPTRSIHSVHLYSDGGLGSILNVPHGAAKVPPWDKNYCYNKHAIFMKGREVFKMAVSNMVSASHKALEVNKKTLQDVDMFLFHQANIRIIDMCLKILDIPKEKTWINVDRYGNTSAATLPVCLSEAWHAGKIKENNLILMATFGGGVTWASGLMTL